MSGLKDIDQQRTFGRRAAILVGGKVLLGGALLWRMFDLQVRNAEKYAVLSEENRINTHILIPPRGRILDRFGVPIAINQEDYRVLIVPEQVKNLQQILARVASVVEITDEDRSRISRNRRRRRRFQPLLLKSGLTWEQVAKLEINAPDLAGLRIERGLSRQYPYDAVAHALGYVGPVTEREKKAGQDPMFDLPDFRIGKAGLERSYDKKLRGSSGTKVVEINASGRVQRELRRKPGTAGEDLITTLDIGLQTYVSGRIAKEKAAAAVIVDVLTGDVLAMASTPGYEPNAFVQGISPATWRGLRTNPLGPLTNKAISGTYAPGSTYKMLVALAGLESGLINANTGFICPGAYHMGSARFHCWRRGGHGVVSLHNGIKQSCDVYFYNVAHKIGIERIHDMSLRLGLGKKLGIDLPRESAGLVPNKAWKKKALRDRWYPGETVVAGIGQGYVLTTPLQLAVMSARLATGKAVVPRMARPAGAGVPNFADLGVNPRNLAAVQKGMMGVTNEPGGTAFWTRIVEKEFAMAGKTGTSQVRRITRAERARGVIRNKDLPWERRDHALFVAYAPVDNPRYAAAVIVEHGGSGSRAAAPIAKDILLTAQRRRSATVGPTGPAKGAGSGGQGERRG